MNSSDLISYLQVSTTYTTRWYRQVWIQSWAYQASQSRLTTRTTIPSVAVCAQMMLRVAITV